MESSSRKFVKPRTKEIWHSSIPWRLQAARLSAQLLASQKLHDQTRREPVLLYLRKTLAYTSVKLDFCFTLHTWQGPKRVRTSQTREILQQHSRTITVNKHAPKSKCAFISYEFRPNYSRLSSLESFIPEVLASTLTKAPHLPCRNANTVKRPCPVYA